MNILLICPQFYGYENKIKNEIEAQGNYVDLFCEYKCKYSFFEKVISKTINKNLYLNTNIKIQNNILEYTNNKKYQIVLVFVGRFLTETFIQKLKNQQKETKFILYLWDDVKRIQSFNNIKKYFNIIYSFDRYDCEKFGFKFLPLFYSKGYEITKNRKNITLYGAFSSHSDRLKIINELSNQISNSYFYIFMYKREYIKYFFLKFIKSFNKSIHISTKSLSEEQNIKNMQNSKCILDIQYPSQTGLTIRSIEAIGCGNKLLTTNNDIIHYDFYNPKNIYIIDRNNPRVPEKFFENDYENLAENIYQKYSISNFIRTLLSVEL